MGPDETMGFKICYDSSLDTDATLTVDRAMLVQSPNTQMSDSGVWECDTCYYVNCNQPDCLGCGKPFAHAHNCQPRLGLFPTSDQPRECTLPDAHRAALAYQHAVRLRPQSSLSSTRPGPASATTHRCGRWRRRSIFWLRGLIRRPKSFVRGCSRRLPRSRNR